MNRDDVLRIAKQAGMSGMATTVVCEVAEIHLFAELVMSEFLEKSGQYITNDASREAAIKEAVEAEREKLSAEIEHLERTKAEWRDLAYKQGAELQAIKAERDEHKRTACDCEEARHCNGETEIKCSSGQMMRHIARLARKTNE